MRVADLMSRDVEFIPADATVQEAAELMGELDVGALPVGGADELRGIVTMRDILYRVVAAGLDSSTVTVADAMSTSIFSCREEDSLEAALDLMGSHNVRRLPVVDGAGQVVGWLTLSEISRRLLLDSGVMRRALEELVQSPAANPPAAA